MRKCNKGKITDRKGKSKIVQSGAEPKAGAGALDARRRKIMHGKGW